MSQISSVGKSTLVVVLCGMVTLGITVLTIAAIPKPTEVRSRSEDVARRWAIEVKRPLVGAVCADYRDVEGRSACAVTFVDVPVPVLVRCQPYPKPGAQLCEMETR